MITLYQAGAGSGKTYTITKEIVERLARGETRPERILATTFTRKAAAELKDRIQSRLLHPEQGDPEIGLERRLELAGSVDQALIGTVHSVGHQLLSRYALHLGISPQLEPIEEKAQERHLRRIMAEMPQDGLRELDRIGQCFGIEKAQELVLDVLDQKRSNAIPDETFQESMVQSNERFIEVISGGTSADIVDFAGFYDACRTSLESLAGNGDETKGSREARETLQQLIRSGREQWQVWGKVAKLKWTQKSADDAAELTGLARRANVHKMLHDDLRSFTACLVERVLELQQHYQDYKATHGLVDFTDLEERFLQVLQDDAIRDDLAFGLDLVVVDEFQDTNPIQLAIFQGLADLAAASLWVGDEKQAIYGFRGTDAALMRDVLGTVPEGSRKTLQNNWRSQPGLVRVVNKIFEPVFGQGTALEPVHDGPSRIERWKLQGKNKDIRREAFLAQMQELEEDPGDIAILVRKNQDATGLAAGLQGIGIPALVQTSGLLSTKEGEMLLAGLRLVADSRDRLAAATIRHIEDESETPAWFQEALASPGEAVTGASVEAVQAIDARTLPPSGVVGAAIQALRLPDRVPAWGEPARRSANLDELLALGQRYEDESEQEGKAATLTGLIYWLEDLRSKEEDLLPVPTGVNAVTIMTVWKAKGLEWPVVVLFQDGSPPDPHPFRIHVEGGDAAHGRPLQGRRIRYWTYPFGTTYHGGLNADGSGIQDAAKQSPEGIAIQEARDAEARRLLYVGFTRTQRSLIVAEARRHSLGLLESLDEVLPPDHTVETDRHGASYMVRTCDAVPEESNSGAANLPWFEEAHGPAPHVARYWSPSKAEPVQCEVYAEKLPGKHPFPAAVKTEDWTALGEAVHAYLAALPALRGLDDAVKAAHAEACLWRWGRMGDLEPEAVVRAGKRLEEWVEGRMPGAAWHVEASSTRPRTEGGQWAGAIDLLLEDADDAMVVDHKSADYRESGWAQKAEEYAGQLAVYVEVVGEGSKAAVHLPLGGGMVEVKGHA